MLVAEVTGRLVGFATARAVADDGFTVMDLFVDPDHMRTGIGRALIDAIVAAATTSRRTRIEVEANRHAVAFYGLLGFIALQEVQLEFGTALRMVMSVPVLRSTPNTITAGFSRRPERRDGVIPDGLSGTRRALHPALKDAGQYLGVVQRLVHYRAPDSCRTVSVSSA